MKRVTNKQVKKETIVRELADGKIVPEIAGKEVEVIFKNGRAICTSKDCSCLHENK